MEKIKTLLDEEIRSQIKDLHDLNYGTTEYDSSTNGLSKMIDKYVDLSKLESDYDFKSKQLKQDVYLKEKELDQMKKDQKTKNIITGATFGLSLLTLVWGALNSWQFEKEGTVNSSFGKAFMKSISNLVKK